MASDDMNAIYMWVIGGVSAIGYGIMGINYMRTEKVKGDVDKVRTDLSDHILHSQETYAKAIDMNVGLQAATKLAENIAITLNTKMDKTQESVQRIAVEQGKQGENLKNVGEKLTDIAQAIKDKAN